MKNTFMLMMSMVMMLAIGLVSCSKDDNEEEDKPEVPAESTLVGGVWQQTEKTIVGPYTVVYYDLFGEDGSLREYLVWLEGEIFRACSFKDYNWKVEGGLFYKKAAEADGYGPGERCTIVGDKFYLGKESRLAAERLDMTAEMEEWFETAFKED